MKNRRNFINPRKMRLVTTVLLFCMMAWSAIAAEGGNVAIAPAKETPGNLLHGHILTAEGSELPVLVRVNGVKSLFVGQAYLQAPGRAVVRLVLYDDVAVDGYVVSPKDHAYGIAVKCLHYRKIEGGKECVVGQVFPGDQVIVIFPKGINIMEGKPQGK